VKRNTLLVALALAVAFAAGFATSSIARRTSLRRGAESESDSVEAAEVRLRESYVQTVTALDSRARAGVEVDDLSFVRTLDSDRKKAFLHYREATAEVYRAAGREVPAWVTVSRRDDGR
jgi:hypothetical protein